MLYVILDSNRQRFRRFLGPTVRLCGTRAEIAAVYDEAPAELTWVTYSRKFIDLLLRTVLQRPVTEIRRHDCILTVAAPKVQSIPSLHGIFSRIVGVSPAYRWLSKDELAEVLFDPALDRSELFIAAAADPVAASLLLVRADFRQFVLPFSFFAPSGDGIRPDFSKVRVTDFGRTLALGDYEASADAILYDADREHRKKVGRLRKESEKTFGAALLRLRKERRLTRKDFAPLSEKTIARLERNEIGKPHGATLQAIADRLGVSAEEIPEY